jgi:hypothetical protein
MTPIVVRTTPQWAGRVNASTGALYNVVLAAEEMSTIAAATSGGIDEKHR